MKLPDLVPNDLPQMFYEISLEDENDLKILISFQSKKSTFD